MDIVTASMMNVGSLYHYQRLNLDRLAPIIEKKAIYFSNPKDFNDPWDCRPCFDVACLDDPAIYEQHVEFFDRSDRKRFPKPEAEHVQMTEQLRTDRAYLESLVTQMSGIEHEIQKRYRVYCLTTKPDCTLMWAHYAGNHSGVCLEFGVRNHVMAGALKIEYCDAYPSLNFAEDGMENLLPLITKCNDWAYEDEYRLIAQERSAANTGGTLMTDNNLLVLPSGVLKAVIVGCMMSEPDREAIRKLIDKSGEGIALKQAVRVPNRYAVSITT